MYKIIETTAEGELVKTTVEYTLSDKTTKRIEIPHFMPKNVDDVISNIESREETEESKLNNVKIAEEMQIYKEMDSADIKVAIAKQLSSLIQE